MGCQDRTPEPVRRAAQERVPGQVLLPVPEERVLGEALLPVPEERVLGQVLLPVPEERQPRVLLPVRATAG